ncbi:DUF1294 domain-containing protein [Mesobacillus jeotgali]|uniref:DUF1294 domain-containing protein n=1 Tax=Mesobacillus jeotgali TaxID=129985 RepID=UPI0011169845|nr:DUF1294 domain-containing protein [Mesobacillus jeotgali]
MEIMILTGFVSLINLAAFILMGADKQRAMNNQYRISEKTLWNVAFFGGAIGAATGMKHFRHKTKHSQFKYGLPALAIIEIGIYIYFFMLLA